MLVVEHRIGIGDGARHQRARVGRRRGHDDLQAGRAVEPRLGVLAVVRPGMTQPAPRHAHHHRHRAAPAIADLGGVVHELVEAGRDEVVELHLADRPLARQRGADAGAEHGALGERRVEDPIAELLEQRAQQQERVAVGAADVLAEHEDARVGAQRVADAEHHRFEKRAALCDRMAAPASSAGRRRLDVEVQPSLADRAPRRAGAAASPASTPSPACAAAGHGASMTACASTRRCACAFVASGVRARPRRSRHPSSRRAA